MPELTLSQRFALLLDDEKIFQEDFCETTGMKRGTVSNIKTGKTPSPKADFFQAVLKHYPHWNLRWLLAEEGNRFLSDDDIELNLQRGTKNETLLKKIGELTIQGDEKSQDVLKALGIAEQLMQVLDKILADDDEYKTMRADFKSEAEAMMRKHKI